jgi:hypothetical protein
LASSFAPTHDRRIRFVARAARPDNTLYSHTHCLFKHALTQPPRAVPFHSFLIADQKKVTLLPEHASVFASGLDDCSLYSDGPVHALLLRRENAFACFASLSSRLDDTYGSANSYTALRDKTLFFPARQVSGRASHSFIEMCTTTTRSAVRAVGVHVHHYHAPVVHPHLHHLFVSPPLFPRALVLCVHYVTMTGA